MLLKSIELSGFKSFAKRSLFTFSTPISAIVGPNGSGKSNAAEAFRFVLGEQSFKSMRGKRGEDLIWNGGKDAPRAGRASVKLTFDNTKRFLNIDFDEVTIERVVNRDSTNEYLINGSQVRLKDIVELLAGAHIGSSGHHIISQGEADRILGSSPKERREMIEDALGLKIYQYKRQESERKLEKTLENLRQVESLRREVAPHLKFLKKQVEKFEKAGQMKDDLKARALEYLKREDIYLKATKERLGSALSPLEEEFKNLDVELAKAKEELSHSAGADKKSEEVIALEEKIKRVRENISALVQELGNLEGQIVSEERVVARQREIVYSNEHKTIALGDVSALADELEREAGELSESSDTKTLLEKIRSFTSRLRSFVASKKDETDDKLLRETEASIATLIAQKEVINRSLAQVRQEEADANSEYEKLKREIERAKDSSRDAEKRVFQAMGRQKEVASQIDVLREKQKALAIEEEDFKRELAEIAMLLDRSVLDFAKAEVSVDGAAEEERGKQQERRREIEKLKLRLEDAGLSGEQEVMREFTETSERDAFLEKEIHDLNMSVESLEKLIADLGEQLDREFKEGIEKINREFGNFFTLMFGGGSAGLKVLKPAKRAKQDETLDILNMESVPEPEAGEEGIEIDVSLPRKKIKGLMMLSGGERALTSIALLFAMSQVNPPPFIILDETDAALDEANSKKYGDMIESLSKHSQLILITHNRETMSRAGVIYGVTMDAGGVSKTFSIQFDEAVAVAK